MDSVEVITTLQPPFKPWPCGNWKPCQKWVNANIGKGYIGVCANRRDGFPKLNVAWKCASDRDICDNIWLQSAKPQNPNLCYCCFAKKWWIG